MAEEYLLGTHGPERLDIKRAVIATSSTDTTLVAAVTGKKIRVLSLFLVVANSVTVRFESGTGGTALTGQLSFGGAGHGMALPFNPLGWFETTAGALLNLELGGAVSCAGALQYIEV